MAHSLIIKDARVVDPGQQMDEVRDVGICEGVFVPADTLTDAEIISLPGKVIAPGFIDMHVHLRDPGFTHKEDIIIDIGAHIGTFTVPLAKRLNENGRVYAFEADENNYQLLKANIKENHLVDKVLVKNAVISNYIDNFVNISPNKNNSGANYFVPTKDKPSSRIEVIKLDEWFLLNINNKVDIPLVLHGASGVPDSDVRKAVSFGINKVNVNTAFQQAFTAKVKELFEEDPELYDPRKYCGPGRDAIKERVKEKIDVLGSKNKA